VHRTNLSALADDVVAVLPEGAGGLTAARFAGSAAAWVAPELYGVFDRVAFTSAAGGPGRRSTGRRG
jgi:hypothetical protein